MKMLFSARELAQIEPVRQRLTAAGVRCVIRDFAVTRPAWPTCWYPELWIESETENTAYSSWLDRLIGRRAR